MEKVGDMLSTLAPEFHNVTNSTLLARPKSYSILFKVVYFIGIVGNAAAIAALNRGKTRVRNRKHLLLLTTLAANDLVALVGMLGMLWVGEVFPWLHASRAYCGARVFLRVFGIGSVCIAVTMALERYFALTRPFLYQKHVTYYVIRSALVGSLVWAALLTCAPWFGLGRYYCPDTQRCIRYRLATTTAEIAYAVVFIIHGTLLCLVLVFCNIAVIRALYAISAPRAGAPVVRRFSKSSSGRQRERADAADRATHNAATVEEVTFSRLMATLSVLFMICWLPQMVTSTLYLCLGPAAWPRLAPLGALSDLLMLLNYVMNPLLYVLRRRPCRLSLSNLFYHLTHCTTNHKMSSESIKTSCCQPETIILSESGAELKPLRPAPRAADLVLALD